MNQRKIAQRRTLRRLRRGLDPGQRQRDDAAIAHQLWRALQFHRGRQIAIYAPVGSEVNLAGFVRRARAAGRQLWLPTIRHRALHFLPANAPLRPGRHRILAPCSGRARAPWALSVIVTPLLGFDLTGRRLGQGGGYYDRTLARLRPRRPWVLGVAYDCQELPAVAADPWDQRLDGIITPTRIHFFCAP